jgi:kynurenine formamidase
VDLAGALRSARVYDLEQPRYAGAPTFPVHEPGLLLHLHRRHEPGLGEARTGASALLVMAEHSGTHIDALCHQAEDLTLDATPCSSVSALAPYGTTGPRTRQPAA